MAMHYGVAVMPARVRRPKDKAKAEVGVQIVERWILARLRNRTFFSLAELNTAIRELLLWLNRREFPKLKGESRTSLFERYDKPALKPLPTQRYEFGEWSTPRVNIDYHVEVDKHFYSVPCKLAREEVDARLTASTVEIFHKSSRVASHLRSYVAGKATTVIEHMPKNHQEYGAWPPSRLAKWADEIGPNTAAVAEKILARPIHPALGYRQCLGLLRLEKEHTRPRLEAACKRAMAFQTESYQSVKTILHLKLDQQEILPVEELPVIEHPHIRGSDYYQ
jgi:transposase